MLNDASLGASTGRPRTLKEILGSGRLTPEQLQMASLPSVRSMFTTNTPEYKEELAWFLQRFIIDGFLSGVDVVSKIKGKKTFNLDVVDVQSRLGKGGHVIGTAGPSKVYWDKQYWDKQSVKNKLQTFYHELGHSVLGRSHTEKEEGSSIMSWNGPGGSWLDKYDWAVGELFNPDGAGKLVTSGQGPAITPSMNNLGGGLSGFMQPTIRIGGGGTGLTLGGFVNPMAGIGGGASFGGPIGGTIFSAGGPATMRPAPTMTVPGLTAQQDTVFARALKDVGASSLRMGA